MPDEEWGAKAGRERRLRFGDPDFGSSDLGGITGDKMIHRLVRREFCHRRQDAKCVTGQKNYIRWMSSHAGHLGVFYKSNRVSAASVLGNTDVRKIHFVAFVIENDIFQERSEVQSAENV